MYAVQITKMKEADETGIALHKHTSNTLHFQLSDRTLRINEDKSETKVTIFNVAGSQIGQFSNHDYYTFKAKNINLIYQGFNP